MKKRNFFLIVLLFSLLEYSTAFAGNPSPFMRYLPRRGDVALALRSGLIFDGNAFWGNVTLAYGLQNGIALNGHIGLGQGLYDPYLGGDLRLTLFANRNLGFDAYFGGHTGGLGSGLDLGGILDFNIGGLGFITGIDSDFILEGNASANPVNIFFGIDIGLSKTIRFAAVAGLGLTDTASDEIAAGFNFYF